MIAVPLIFGRLTAGDYEDGVAADPRIDALARKDRSASKTSNSRATTTTPDKRSIANALTVEFKDGSKLDEVVCEYPIGHKRRRDEGMPVLVEKFKTNLARRFPAKQSRKILDLFLNDKQLQSTPVHEFVDPDGDMNIAGRIQELSEEIRHYPTPIARCDEQLTALLDERSPGF